MRLTSIMSAACAATGAALVATLTGCGGGLTDDVGPIGPAPTSMYQSFNTIADYCGISDRLPAAKDKGVSLSPFATAGRYSWSTKTASVVSAPMGWNPIPEAPDLYADAKLRIPVSDFRTDTPIAAWTDVGYATGEATMGAQFRLNVPAGGIACVAPAAWLVPDHIENYYNLSLHQNVPIQYRRLSWESQDRSPLPVDSLPGYPVDAFELVANYTPASGRVFFTPTKKDVPDQTAIRVCHLAPAATTWACSVPGITDNGTSWLFTVDGIDRGAYVLVSTHAGSGQ